MIRLTSARGPGEPPLAVDAEKVIGLEMVLETRGGIVYESLEGVPTSIGTKVYLAGRAEPLVVLEHLPQVEKIVKEARAEAAKVAITDFQGRTIREGTLAANPDIRDARPRE